MKFYYKRRNFLLLCKHNKFILLLEKEKQNRTMKKTENLDFLIDLIGMIESDTEAFIRYDERLNEIICCLFGDQIEYYSTISEEDMELFTKRLLKYAEKKIKKELWKVNYKF